ncbi:MAG: hypothetical protein AABY27_03800, partial [Pseudomonadota bacterium]
GIGYYTSKSTLTCGLIFGGKYRTCIFIIGLAIFMTKDSFINKHNIDSVNLLLNDIKADSVLLPQATFFNMIYTYSNPLKELNVKYTIIPTGWTIFSPRFYNVLRDIGLKKGSDIFPYLIQSEKAFIIGGKDIIMPVSTFIKETYGIETEFKMVKTFPSLPKINMSFSMYKIHKK